MENGHSPAAQHARRIRADRQRIQPHIDLVRGVAAGKRPAGSDLYAVRIALLLVRREEALADDLPTATLNLLAELAREANRALRRILLAVAGEMGPLAQSQNWDALLAEIGHGESAVWQMLREAVERAPAPDDGQETENTDAKWGPNGGRATINARIIDLLQQHPEAAGWSARKIAAHLKCGKSTVADTSTYRVLEVERTKARAERANAQRRNRKRLFRPDENA